MPETRKQSCGSVKAYKRGGEVPGPVKGHTRSNPGKTCHKAKVPEKKRRHKAWKSSNPDYK